MEEIKMMFTKFQSGTVVPEEALALLTIFSCALVEMQAHHQLRTL
jgi:hypothetical protein